MAISLEKKIELVQAKIAENPKLKNATHIGFSIKKKGIGPWEKKTLEILGRVNKQAELDVINSIIKEDLAEFIVSNELRVENRS